MHDHDRRPFVHNLALASSMAGFEISVKQPGSGKAMQVKRGTSVYPPYYIFLTKHHSRHLIAMLSPDSVISDTPHRLPINAAIQDSGAEP